MEPVHVELPDERVDVPMPEIERKDFLFESGNIFDSEVLP
jgi:hypothetical protein